MRKFSNQHEWVEISEDIGIVGITDYAQNQLGEVVFVELPKVGQTISKGAEVAVVESVKAASDVYSPVSGEVIEINERLLNQPDLINTQAEKEGWFFKVRLADPGEVDLLMDTAAYDAYIKSL